MPRLITLGGLSVRNGTVINGLATPRSRLAILAVLAVAGDRGVRREKLAAMFWAESDDDKARNALRQALFTLKRDLGSGDMTLGTADLRLNPDVLSADVTEFEAALRADRYEDAAALYGGPFLDGVFLRESPEFERWAEDQRIRLSREYERALEKAAAAAAGRGDLHSAAIWWERRSVHDPLSGRVARLYMEALAAAGDRERAIRHAMIHAQLVRQELGAEPDAEVLRLADRVRKARGTPGMLAEAAVVDGARSPSLAQDSLARVESVSAPVGSRGVATTGWLAGSITRASLTVATVAGLVIVGRALLTTESSFQPQLNAAETVSSGRVAVSTFDNLTGDSALENLGRLASLTIIHRLQDAVTSDLVGPLVALDDAVVTATSGSNTWLPHARSLQAQLLVHGAVVRIGSALEFRAQLVDVQSKGVVASLDAISPSSDSVEAALAKLRDRVAVAVALAIDGGRIPPASQAPTNVEALREYLEGLAKTQSGGVIVVPAAAEHYMAAARLDTTFTAPLVSAAMAFSSLISYAREDRRADWRRRRDSVLQVLENRRDRLTRLDRQGLAYFDAVVRGDVIAMRKTAASAASLSPGSNWSCHAARMSTAVGQFREAVEFMRPVDFERGWARSNFGCWKYLLDPLHLLADHAAEVSAADRWVRLNPEASAVSGRYTRALIGSGRIDEAVHRAKGILAGPGDITASAKQIAEEFQAHNEFGAALDILNTTIDWIHSPAGERAIRAAGKDSSELRSAIGLREGRLLYMAGRLAEARNAFTRFLPETPPGERRYMCSACGWDVTGVRAYLALIAAREGNRVIADSAIRELERSATSTIAGLGPYLAAKIAAALGDRERAVKILGEALRNPDMADLLLFVHREHDWFALRSYAPFRQLTAGR